MGDIACCDGGDVGMADPDRYGMPPRLKRKSLSWRDRPGGGHRYQTGDREDVLPPSRPNPPSNLLAVIAQVTGSLVDN